ncbi:hypothetical protein NC652_014157 [Populus alba x Populus x berolinensis]|nr:hypothetical protein NC652_014157 [Populus alba x Populus x berolinensis]
MDLPELWAIFGPGVAGAVFGAGWWFWIDAVVCSSVKVSVVHYLPGIFASIASLMFNCVRKEDIDYSPYEEGEWSISGLIDTRFNRQNWPFSVDRNCWHLAVCVCADQWPNLLGFILGMSYGDMCSLLELGIMTEGVGCVCISNYSIRRTEHSSTSCKCLSCARILEHEKKQRPVQLFWNLRCLVHMKVKSHKLWCFFNAAFVQKPNSNVFRLVTRII